MSTDTDKTISIEWLLKLADMVIADRRLDCECEWHANPCAIHLETQSAVDALTNLARRAVQ